MKFVCNNANGGSLQNMSTSFKTLVALLATTSNLRRITIESLMASAADVPNSTDCGITYDVSLVTADGTGTASAGQPFNGPLETGTFLAAATTCKANYTSEPTVTASTSRLILQPNQRGLLRYDALSDAHRWTSPAVAANGFTFRAKSTTYTSTVNGNVVFDE